MSTLDRQVEHRLFDRDIRYTKGRRRVIEALAASDGPRSAAELHVEVQTDVPLSSLYRSLAVLEDAGVIAPHYSSKGITRYELAEWLAGHHHHLQCVSCGSVEDIELSEDVELELDAIAERIGADSRFRTTDHALEIEGYCAHCS